MQQNNPGFSVIAAGTGSGNTPFSLSAARSSSSAPSASSAPVSGYDFPLDSVQHLIATTLNIAPGLTGRSKHRDLRLAYAKYEAIQTTMGQVSRLVAAGTWTQHAPTNDEIIEVFISTSNYFHYYDKVFPLVTANSNMQKWLCGAPDAPDQSEIWGSRRPSVENLKVYLKEQGVQPLKKKDRKKDKDKSKKKASSTKEPNV